MFNFINNLLNDAFAENFGFPYNNDVRYRVYPIYPRYKHSYNTDRPNDIKPQPKPEPVVKPESKTNTDVTFDDFYNWLNEFIEHKCEEAVNKALKKYEPIKPQPEPEVKDTLSTTVTDALSADDNTSLLTVSYDDITKAIENIVSNILNNANSVTDTSNNTNTTPTTSTNVEYKKPNKKFKDFTQDEKREYWRACNKKYKQNKSHN
jgi:hypothetical protein